MLLVELDGVTVQVEEDTAAVDRICRELRRVRDPRRARRRRAGAALARPQGCLPGDGPDVPRLLRAGRRRAADEAAGGAPPHRRALAASTACGSATSSTQATATCTRSSSTTPPRARRRPRRSSPRRSWRPASTPAARSPASMASASTRPARCRRCSRSAIWRPSSASARAFDPDGLANPGKVLPTPRLCGEVPGPYRAASAGEDRPCRAF